MLPKIPGQTGGEWTLPPKNPTSRVNKKWGYKIRLKKQWFESSALSPFLHVVFSKELAVSAFLLPGTEKTFDIMCTWSSEELVW